MRKIQINKALVRLSPKEFRRWFEKTHSLNGENWEDHYKAIGGKLDKPKPKPKKEE